MKEHTSD